MRALALSAVAFLVFGQAPEAQAGETEACAKVSGVIDRVVDKYPDLTVSEFKSRMAVVRIGSRAGVAFAYAVDEGWSEDELAPLGALRDLREPDADGKTISANQAPDLVYEHALALVQVLKTRCPSSEYAELESIRE